MSLLCRLGFHDNEISSKWEPSFYARIVTRFTFTVKCRRCGKIINKLDQRWDESTNEFVDA